jgi:hypothetical protein
MTWPDGRDGAMLLRGAARDLYTHTEESAAVIAEARLTATIDAGRTVSSLEVSPGGDRVRPLIGVRGGGGFRAQLQEVLAADFAGGTPLYFLLDDVPAATLIGGFGWHLWPADPASERRRLALGGRRDMSDICSGFRADGRPAAMSRQGLDLGHNLARAVELIDPADPLGWHEVPPPPGDAPCMRRRRRVDVIAEADCYRIDAMFRDAMWDPDGHETVVHEYSIEAAVAREGLALREVTATARVLPFAECPAAARNASLLQGQSLSRLRHSVLETLSGTACCTHLNDALRALGEVGTLIGTLAVAS